MDKKKLLATITWIVIFLIGIVLSFKSFREPDVWWMFRVGDWMAENGKVPTQDVFSFTHEGVDWISVKWFFELVAYWVAEYIGPEFIVILQTLVNILLLVFLKKAYQSLAKAFDIELNSYLSVGFLLTALIFLFGVDFRMISRPEMTSHILTLVFFAFLLKYRQNKSNAIYGLIPLQILWVNAHEAYGTGMVILGTFLGAEIIEWWFKKENRSIDKRLLIALGAAILSTAINPRGLYMLIHPYVIFTQVGSNHYTSELNSVFYKPDYYFGFKDPWIMLGLMSIAVGGFIYIGLKQDGFKKLILDRLGLGYSLSILLFFYLGLTGHRNIPFPIIVCSPLIAVFLDLFFKRFKLNQSIVAYGFLTVLSVGFYVNVIAGTHYKWFNSSDRYGIRVYAEKNPAGAAKFVRENNIEGLSFTDYLTSAYFLWEMRPDFKSFIDLRDLDIFPMDFFHEFAAITYYPNKFDEVDTKYNFNYVMLYRPQFGPLHQHLYNSQDWEMVYGDPVVIVYVKNNEQNAEVIAKHGISNHPNGTFNHPHQPEPAGISTLLSTVFNPLYDKNAKDEYLVEEQAATYYSSVGDLKRAISFAYLLTQKEETKVEGYSIIGNLYMQTAESATDTKYKQELMNQAIAAYKAGFKIDKENYGCLFGQGWYAANNNQFSNAIKWFDKAEKINHSDASLYQLKARCHNALVSIQKQKADYHINSWFENMEIAHKIDPSNQNIVMQLLIGHCQRKECDLAQKYFKVFNREPWMTDQDIQFLEKCRNGCN